MVKTWRGDPCTSDGNLHGYRLGRYAVPGVMGHVDALVIVREYRVSLLPISRWVI